MSVLLFQREIIIYDDSNKTHGNQGKWCNFPKAFTLVEIIVNESKWK